MGSASSPARSPTDSGGSAEDIRHFGVSQALAQEFVRSDDQHASGGRRSARGVVALDATSSRLLQSLALTSRHNGDRFRYPTGLVALWDQQQQSIIVADSGNSRLVRITTEVDDNCLAGAQWTLDSHSFPCGVAVSPRGDIVVAEWGKHRLKLFASNGSAHNSLTTRPAAAAAAAALSTLDAESERERLLLDTSSRGGADLDCWHSMKPAFSSLNRPYGVAVSRGFDVAISQVGAHSIRIVSAEGSVRTLGSHGTGRGEFDGPRGVCLSAANESEIVVADSANDRVQVFRTDGTFVRAFGSHGRGPGQFFFTDSVAVDAAGTFVVSDFGNHRVQVFRADGTFVRAFGSFGLARGRFQFPAGVQVTSDGSIVVCDTNNHRLHVWS